MQRLSLTVVILIAFLSPLSALQTVQAQPSPAPQTYIRFAHFAPRVEAVDFYMDGNLSRTTYLPFTELGEWMAVPPGKHSFAVVLAGGAQGAALLNINDVYLDGETWHTIAIVNSGNQLKPAVVEENFRDMQSVVSRVTFFNAMDDGTAINFDRSGETFVSEIGPVGGDKYHYSFQSGMDARLYDYFAAVDTNNPDRVLARIDYKQMIEGSVYLFAMVGGPHPQLVISETPRYEYRLVRGMMDEPGKLRQAFEADWEIQVFLRAMDRAGLSDILDGDKKYTILAPVDYEMENALKEIGNNTEALRYFLEGLIIEGDLKSHDMFLAGKVTALNGTVLPVTMIPIPNNNEFGFMKIDGREVVEMNVPAANGTIHVLGQFQPGVTVWTPATALVTLEAVSMGDEPVGGVTSNSRMP